MFRKRRSRRKFKNAGIRFFLTLATLALVANLFSVVLNGIKKMISSLENQVRYGLEFFSDFFSTLIGTTMAALCIGLIVLIVFWHIKESFKNKKIKLQKKLDLQNSIASLSPSIDRNDYIIDLNDYRRGNPKENFYRKTFSLRLLETFQNGCAKCASKDNGIDLDHFIFSKNEGGCFIMRHQEGYLVNNAIPLCRTCNRSKSDDNHRAFFTEDELSQILHKNMLMTKILNEKIFLSQEGQPIKHKKISNG